MNIPDKALEAAARAEWAKYLERTPERQEPHDWESLEPNERCDVREYILPILEAAAPFIAAQALRDALDEVDTMRSGPAAAPYVSATKAVLRSIADQWDEQ